MNTWFLIEGLVGFAVGLMIFFAASMAVQQINAETGPEIRPLGIYDYAALSGIPISLASLPVIAYALLKKFNLFFMIGSSVTLVLIWFGVLFSVGS